MELEKGHNSSPCLKTGAFLCNKGKTGYMEYSKLNRIKENLPGNIEEEE